MFDATIRKLSELQDVIEFTSSYQAAFDTVASLISETSPYSRRSVEAYFQATMLMSSGSEYSNPVTIIQKDWKDNNTNLPETILQIIRYFEFMKGSTKDQVLLISTQISSTTTQRATEGSCPNRECVEKGLTTHYSDRC